MRIVATLDLHRELDTQLAVERDAELQSNPISERGPAHATDLTSSAAARVVQPARLMRPRPVASLSEGISQRGRPVTEE
jgi:hypothetical protein